SIEDQFGDEEALENLIESAHERDIKVVLELVTNYSAESFINKEEQATDEWFKENDITPIEANEWMEDSLTFDQTNPEVKNYLFDVADIGWITSILMGINCMQLTKLIQSL